MSLAPVETQLLDRNLRLLSALLPCQGINILVPQSLVAGNFSLDALAAPQVGPDWLAGAVRIAGERVPAARFELLSGTGQPSEAIGRRSRIVVLGSGHLAVGILTTAAPRLINLSPEVLGDVALLPSDNAEYCAARVNIGHVQAIVPNMQALAAAVRVW